MKKSRLSPIIWSGLVLILCQALTFFVVFREKVFFEENQIVSPDISLGPILAYFFGVVILLGLILFLIPLSKLRIVFRILFALMFSWGAFIILALTAPAYLAYTIAVIAGLVWFFWTRIWLHNLLLIVALSGAGSAFGFLFSPWTFVLLMLIISVYDVLAVRFGFMLWMADKLSESGTLPAFIFPKQFRDWNLNLTRVNVGDLKKEEADKREYSILGGGDIGFPLMFSVSVFFDKDMVSAMVVAAFALAGLMGAYLLQLLWLKGKPVPALPPITLGSLAGFLVVTMFI